ncbi:TspO/MBR family protein [Rhodoplanes sp. Z2-YC6860]|uniref:TspO/MBR family protein n=1 Tax=Rhodoplanes sp. Z2-YC6860 TaxID=674703 RepID=UPI00078E5B05|nr:TspO/MBR family protein [Rhodoplanes sp. Z2-YC6860]AMN44094.1 tryptophan-rich sensory protein [Rhodoplanes sp. Z2-YC6860]
MFTIASPKSRNVALGGVVVSSVVIASGLGQLATFPNLGWYSTLVKPAFNPPNWIFGPVWTTLYALMAFASWRIMRLPGSSQRSLALLLFFGQLVLNAVWSWMFFGLHSPLLGLIDIIPQLSLIVLTIVAFSRLDVIAGWLLVPLAAWVSFATILNVAVWRLNA